MIGRHGPSIARGSALRDDAGGLLTPRSSALTLPSQAGGPSGDVGLELPGHSGEDRVGLAPTSRSCIAAASVAADQRGRTADVVDDARRRGEPQRRVGRGPLDLSVADDDERIRVARRRSGDSRRPCAMPTEPGQHQARAPAARGHLARGRLAREIQSSRSDKHVQVMPSVRSIGGWQAVGMPLTGPASSCRRGRCRLKADGARVPCLAVQRSAICVWWPCRSRGSGPWRGGRCR